MKRGPIFAAAVAVAGLCLAAFQNCSDGGSFVLSKADQAESFPQNTKVFGSYANTTLTEVDLVTPNGAQMTTIVNGVNQTLQVTVTPTCTGTATPVAMDASAYQSLMSVLDAATVNSYAGQYTGAAADGTGPNVVLKFGATSIYAMFDETPYQGAIANFANTAVAGDSKSYYLIESPQNLITQVESIYFYAVENGFTPKTAGDPTCSVTGF